MARSCMCETVDENVGFRDCARDIYSRKRPADPPCGTTFLRPLRQAAREEVLSNENHVSEEESETQRSHVDLPPNSSSPNGDGFPLSLGGNVLASPFVILTDPDVLDCPICLLRLTIPVYQCKNGHVSCASCCTKMEKKCGLCRARIGYFRCRAIEKVLESILSTCRYKQQGCTAIFSYSNKLDHEKSCRFGPCTCPHIYCDHVTTFAELYFHFRSHHSQCTNEFGFNEPISIPLVKKQNNVYFQERKDKTLFILHRIKQNLFTLLCVGPTSRKGFSYHLFARYGRNPEEMNSIESKSIAANIPGKVPDPLPPSDIFGRRTKHMSPLTLTIWSGDD